MKHALLLSAVLFASFCYSQDKLLIEFLPSSIDSLFYSIQKNEFMYVEEYFIHEDSIIARENFAKMIDLNIRYGKISKFRTGLISQNVLLFTFFKVYPQFSSTFNNPSNIILVNSNQDVLKGFEDFQSLKFESSLSNNGYCEFDNVTKSEFVIDVGDYAIFVNSYDSLIKQEIIRFDCFKIDEIILKTALLSYAKINDYWVFLKDDFAISSVRINQD